MKKNTILVILDGWGYSDPGPSNAVTSAPTPWMKLLQEKYPSTLLFANGEHVGLDKGRMGNSEVGHLTIGAGRIIETDFVRICKYISQEKMYGKISKIESEKIHIVGILSEGGVHGHIDILKSVVRNAKAEDVMVHVISDGRDSEPKCIIKDINEMHRFFKEIGKGRIVSISGRYYSMDRDKREERTSEAYEMMTGGIGIRKNIEYNYDKRCDDTEESRDYKYKGLNECEILEYVEDLYEKGCTDEFIPPKIFNLNDKIFPGEIIIFTNFRPDRMRQLVRRFEHSNICYTMTNYDPTINADVIFESTVVTNTLAEAISKQNLTQAHIAESEKYAHVTYFLNGGIENPFDGETRLLIPSPLVDTYDLTPEMSVSHVADEVINAMRKDCDFIVCNFAPADMVGHTGKFIETCKAVSACDTEIGRIYEAAIDNFYTVFITADHGNAEVMEYSDGSPCKTHTPNKVPFIACLNDYKFKEGEFSLADVAPTILSFMGIAVPKEMTGCDILELNQ